LHIEPHYRRGIWLCILKSFILSLSNIRIFVQDNITEHFLLHKIDKEFVNSTVH